jgi:hypothetical protein
MEFKYLCAMVLLIPISSHIKNIILYLIKEKLNLSDFIHCTRCLSDTLVHEGKNANDGFWCLMTNNIRNDSFDGFN